MKKYVIYKASRLPRTESYSGPTWDQAGIREQYQVQYDNADSAQILAAILTEYNGVGFKVAELIDGEVQDD